MDQADIIIAAKCAPDKRILSDIEKAGLGAVELYLSEGSLADSREIIQLCKDFSFRYAVHAPTEGYNPSGLAELVRAIGARIVVFHNAYWEDEWEAVIKVFNGIAATLCIENTYSLHEPLKFVRRYGLGRCLDLEHLQMECAGVFEEVFTAAIKRAAHVHLTGYIYGTQLWHTHIHHSPEHNYRMLDLLRDSGYTGFVVSEARCLFQTYEEFRELNNFYEAWNSKKAVAL